MGSSSSVPTCPQDSRIAMVCPLELSQTCQSTYYGDVQRSQDTHVTTGLVNWSWVTSLSGGSFFAGFLTATLIFIFISWLRGRRKRRRELTSRGSRSRSPRPNCRTRQDSRDEEQELPKWQWPRPSWPQWAASPWSAPAPPMQHQPLQTVMQSQPLMPAQTVLVQPQPSNPPAATQPVAAMSF